MASWHFHWSIAPVIFLVGLGTGIFVAPSGTPATSATMPVEVAVAEADDETTTALQPVEVAQDVPREPPTSEGSMHRAQIPPEAPDTLAHNAAMDEIERFRRQNYDDCVAQYLIGDNCRIIFYPETQAEIAQSQQWQRDARPAVEAQTRWLSEYQERQIRENSR